MNYIRFRNFVENRWVIVMVGNMPADARTSERVGLLHQEADRRNVPSMLNALARACFIDPNCLPAEDQDVIRAAITHLDNSGIVGAFKLSEDVIDRRPVPR
jgi:hypothetical protein